MQHLIKLTLLLIALHLLCNGCTPEQRKRMRVTPSAYGRVDHILVVADNYMWQGAIGDTFRTYFEALYPVTPQPETIFDLRHIQPNEFNSVLKTHRSIIILADLSDEDDPASNLVRKTLGDEKVQRAVDDPNYCMAIHHDRWAENQTVIYWFSKDRNTLLENIPVYHRSAMQEINKADEQTIIAQVYFKGEEEMLTTKMEQDFNVDLKIPYSYVLARNDSSAIWLRKEELKLSSNLLVYVIDSLIELTPENHHAKRNEITQRYISTREDGSYMHIDDRYLPVYYQTGVDLGGYPAINARGLWGMVNDFMGGSFVSYMVQDSARDRTILIDGFVHFPGGQKRPEMRKLDMVLSTFGIIETTKN